MTKSGSEVIGGLLGVVSAKPAITGVKTPIKKELNLPAIPVGSQIHLDEILIGAEKITDPLERRRKEREYLEYLLPFILSGFDGEPYLARFNDYLNRVYGKSTHNTSFNPKAISPQPSE